jgi:hypothetical protein
MSSTPKIPYPHDFQIDVEADRLAVRRELALKQLDPADVIATVEDALSQEPDPRRHPLYGLVTHRL